MWDIQFVDIGGDGLVTNKQTTVDTLLECEIMAGLLCARHLGVQSVTVEHEGDLQYSVKVNGHRVGTVLIRSL